MKILRIIYDWPPPWDGLAPGPYELTQAQVSQGHEVRVVCGWWPKAKGGVPIPGVKCLRLIREFYKGTLLFTIAPLVLPLYLWQRLVWRPDIIHSHGHFGLYVYLYKLVFGWLDKTPLILHLHNTVVGRKVVMLRQEEERGRRDLRPKWLRWPLSVVADRVGVRVAKAVIACSQLVEKEVARYYQPPPDKLFLVENGVNAELFSPSGENKREELSLADAKVVFYNGALTPRKNVNLIIRSLPVLPDDYKLLVVGRGSSEEELKELAVALGVEGRVVFCGYQPYPELPPYFRSADVFVTPALYEGLPKVVLQALACEVPVIGSGFSISEDLVGLEMFLGQPAPEALASQIRRVVEEGIKPSAEIVREKFGWGVKAKEIESVYRKIGK